MLIDKIVIGIVIAIVAIPYTWLLFRVASLAIWKSYVQIMSSFKNQGE